MSEIETFRNLKDISFIEDISIDSLKQEAVAVYQQKYQEITGEKITLYPADPMRILINTYAVIATNGHFLSRLSIPISSIST